ncbi:MAG: ATPase [Hyphomicrobiales bacterium]|nr:MAG: ATPase [Hyphomicrobiales bacterium]
MSRYVIISGCSGGGKSTLIDELARRGHATVPEPGRRVVREQQASGGNALPWADTRAFVDRILAMARADYAAAAANPGWTFFDRGLFDAVSALGDLNGTPLPAELLANYPYHRQVFLTPPWPALYATDGERRHGLAQAEAEYHRLLRDYPAQGYAVIEIPQLPVPARAAFIEETLAAT